MSNPVKVNGTAHMSEIIHLFKSSQAQTSAHAKNTEKFIRRLELLHKFLKISTSAKLLKHLQTHFPLSMKECTYTHKLKQAVWSPV